MEYIYIIFTYAFNVVCFKNDVLQLPADHNFLIISFQFFVLLKTEFQMSTK